MCSEGTSPSLIRWRSRASARASRASCSSRSTSSSSSGLIDTRPTWCVMADRRSSLRSRGQGGLWESGGHRNQAATMSRGRGPDHDPFESGQVQAAAAQADEPPVRPGQTSRPLRLTNRSSAGRPRCLRGQGVITARPKPARAQLPTVMTIFPDQRTVEARYSLASRLAGSGRFQRNE